MELNESGDIAALLNRVKTIAVVGASPRSERPSHDIFLYLRENGYTVIPINPTIAEMGGERAYASVAEYAKENGAPDLVDVFRKPEELCEVVADAKKAGVKRLWFQLGVVNPAAIDTALAAGMDVVVDRCIKIEHRALVN